MPGEKIRTVTLEQSWSEPVYIKPGLEFDIIGPKGAKFRLDADGYIGRVDDETRFPFDQRFTKGIRFKGLPGQEGRKVYIRTFPTGSAHGKYVPNE